jgi:ABC-type Zn uptake system ZnuABC Zn-binding protein ZnuA
VVFLSGAGLEEEFADLLESASGRLVDLSTRVPLRRLEAADGEAHGAHADDGVDVDPHVWFDPTNVMIWTDAVEEALVGLDPDGASVYAANAAAAREGLVALDLWIWEEVSRVPRAARTLVTDHQVLGYFASRYGFEQVGTVFPGASTLAEPSARDLAALVDTVRALGVPAIFVGTTVSSTLAEAIAADTGAEIVRLYTGSLSDGSGPAGSYVDLMRFNVDAIVGALASRE